MQKCDHFSEKTLIFLQIFKRLKFCLPSARAMEKNLKSEKKKKQLILSEWFLKQKFKAETENSSRLS